MKKKGARDIPDFSGRKPSKVPFSKMIEQHGAHGSLPAADQTQAPKPPAEAPRIKPPATSQKSGRRGA